jgi:carboxyl-terminal processing protease
VDIKAKKTKPKAAPAAESVSPDYGYYAPKQRWSLFRVIATLFIAVAIFGAGLAIGRGNLKVSGLSSDDSTASTAGPLDYSSVNQVYNLLKNNYDGTLNQTKLIDGAKAGLVAATGDPYTEYFDPTDAKTFNNELAGSFSGIGAQLGTDTSNNIIVISPISGYPADKAGLQPKDIIAAINGTSTNGMSVDAVVGKIRGPAGSKVTLAIVRDNGNPFNVVITRENITVPSVTWSENGGIGYMKISQFTSDTSALSAQAAQEFKTKGVKAVVLDLRGDPGGYLSAAVDVSSLWLDQGKTVVSERRGSTIIDTQTSSGKDPLKGLPTVVLIDGGSASASEITAGALHDNGSATLVGTQSFGKGSVQQVMDLPDGSEVKITIAHWYTPDGVNINKKGITPDDVVPITTAEVQASQDPQLDKANSILQAKL